MTVIKESNEDIEVANDLVDKMNSIPTWREAEMIDLVPNNFPLVYFSLPNNRAANLINFLKISSQHIFISSLKYHLQYLFHYHLIELC